MKRVAFLLDGYGNRRHYLQLLALKESGFEPKIITFKEGKEGYVWDVGDAKEFCLVLPFSRKRIMKRFSLKCALALLKLLKERKIEIVLTHRYKLLRYLWFCKFFNPQLKIIFHIVIAEAIKGWHQEFWFRRFKKFIDKILVNSIALKEELVKKGLAQSMEVEIFYSGVELKEFALDLDKGEARRRFNLEEAGFIFGMVAQFRKEKDQKGVIKALKLLKEKGHKVKLVLAGDGPKLEEAKKLAEELKVKEDVLFLGRVNPKEIPFLLKALDVFVYATYREGMPMAVLEAMAAGLPVIATDAEGLSDIFQETKKFGYLVPKGNFEKLAEAMEKIINLSEEERSLWGERAKTVIEKCFSSQILKENTIKLFQSLAL